MGFRLIPGGMPQALFSDGGEGTAWALGRETDMATIAAWQPETDATAREECRSKGADAQPARLKRRASVSLVPVFDALDGSLAIGKALVAVL